MYNKVAKRGDAYTAVEALREAKFTIWTNMSQDIADWDFDGYENDKPLTEEEKWEIVDALTLDYLDDARVNLNVDVEGGILAIASLGLWNGRVLTSKEMGNTMSNILFTEEPYANWYIDTHYNLRGYMEHHDGTNYVLYRAWKNDISDYQKDRLRTKIALGIATTQDITRYTKSLGKLALSRC